MRLRRCPIDSHAVIEARGRQRGTLGWLWPLRWAALPALLALYAVLSLQPYDWRIPWSPANHVVPLGEGWDFPAAGIVIAGPPRALLASARRAETLGVALEVRPAATDQAGLARILTLSPDADRRNLTLAQDQRDLVVRLRSQDTDGNGLQDGKPVARLADVFEAGQWVTIDLQLRPGRLTIAIDGVERWVSALPPKVLGSWNSGFGVTLGNERTCNRPWLGTIRRAVITGPDDARDYALATAVEVPSRCSIARHPPKLMPLYHLNRVDAWRNVLMYLPLGCLLGLLVATRSALTFAMLVMAVAATSLGFETAQLFLESRFPSIDDVIFNTLGGALGIGLGFALARRLAAWLTARSTWSHHR
jgi:VanZ family protein